MAATVAVFAGALLVGDSVKASLRSVALGRLGAAAYAISADHFFREQLAGVPLIALTGAATHEASGRRAVNVEVYGVDERFWKFQGYPGAAPGNREAFLSPALAAEFGVNGGRTLGEGITVRSERAHDHIVLRQSRARPCDNYFISTNDFTGQGTGDRNTGDLGGAHRDRHHHEQS